MSSLFTPPSPSKESLLHHTANSVRLFTNNAYEEIYKIQQRGIDLVWNNPSFTPQEIIDSLGEDAVKIFLYHSKVTDLLIELAALEGKEPDIKLPTNAFTVDGSTITVTDQPYQGQ